MNASPIHTIAPGLLPVFRLAAGIRLAFILLVAALMLVAPIPGRELVFPVLTESVLLLAALIWPRLQHRLGRWFLPVMLAWSLLSPLLVRGLLLSGFWQPYLLSAALPRGLPDYDLFVGTGFNLAWLAVPVVLATWQYGRRGLSVTMTVVVVGNLLPVLLPENNGADRAALVVDLAGRLAIIGLVAIVVERLAAAQHREQVALQAANRQLAVRAATVEQLTESRERNRLAREIHDTLAHSLTGLSVQLQALGRLMATDPTAAQVQLKAVQATVRDGIQEARRAIQALRATPLADLGLSAALRQLCHNYAERLGVAFDYQIEDIGPLDPTIEQTVYRVAEAALANVEQHANAVTVAIRLARHDGTLTLTVHDDGTGFDPGQVSADRYGLTGMSERAHAVGAALAVRSEPGCGTEILLSIET